MKSFRCAKCGKMWEFNQSKSHACGCGHTMKITIKGHSGLTSLPPRTKRQRSGYTDAWEPTNIKSSGNSEMRHEMRSAISQKWKVELEELKQWIGMPGVDKMIKEIMLRRL